MRKLADIVTGLVHPGRGRAAEWLSALALLSWGLARTGGAPEATRGTAGGDAVWGTVCTAMGLLGLAALAINGAMPQGSPALRAVCSAFRALFWGNVALGLLRAPLAVEALPLMSAYPWLALFDLLACHRAARDGRVGRCEAHGPSLAPSPAPLPVYA